MPLPTVRKWLSSRAAPSYNWSRPIAVDSLGERALRVHCVALYEQRSTPRRRSHRGHSRASDGVTFSRSTLQVNVEVMVPSNTASTAATRETPGNTAGGAHVPSDAHVKLSRVCIVVRGATRSNDEPHSFSTQGQSRRLRD